MYARIFSVKAVPRILLPDSILSDDEASFGAGCLQHRLVWVRTSEKFKHETLMLRM
jgi:hypothetical protein